MKKVLIMAAAALVAVSCNKKNTEPPVLPVLPDTAAPVSFGATANVDIVQSKSTSAVPTTTKLGVYAFKAATVPANNAGTPGAADAVLWSSASNLEYVWDATLNSASGAYKENGASPKLFWPGSGETTAKLSFASYFPYQANAATGNGVNAYVLTQDLDNQSTAPDYGFAWAKLDGVGRPDPIASKALVFNYKVAKISLSIIGDGTTVGASGIKMQSGGTGEGVVSVKIYGASTGLYKTYSLNLLDGTTSGATDVVKASPITLKGVDQAGGAAPAKPSTNAYVDAVAYLAPSTDTGLKTDGVTVEIVYHDGTLAQTYTATIKANGSTLTGDAALANGLVAGNNYKYTLKLGKAGITFTGTVTDWVDVAGGEIPLE